MSPPVFRYVLEVGGDVLPVGAVEAKIEVYNGLLTQADALGNQIVAGEAGLSATSTRVLGGGRSKFGADSSEVEQLGGTRQSERARAAAKPATP